MERRLVWGSLAALGAVAIGIVLGLPVALWLTWSNGPHPVLVSLGPLVAAVGSSAATLMVAVATYALVRRTGEQADATANLTELTEKEQERNQADAWIQKMRFRQGAGHDSMDLWLVNRGWKPTSIQSIRLRPQGAGEASEATKIEVDFPEGRERGDWIIEPGQRVRFSVELDREEYRVRPGDDVTIRIRPVLGGSLAATFPYPDDGEPALMEIPHPSTLPGTGWQD